jgi:molybdenum cofactor cytidylyltransferase
MTRAPSLCGVILSAGASSRMGRDKALLPWPVSGSVGGTFLSAAIRSLNECTELVIVVGGANASQLGPVADAEGAFLARNLEPELGQFSSLRVGLQEVLSRGRDAAVITLVDRPPLRAATLQGLLAAFHDALDRGKWAVIPEYQGRHGHPIFVGREMIEAFLRAPAESNAREVRHAHEQLIEFVPVDDPFVTLNVDTPEAYTALAGSEPVPELP